MLNLPILHLPVLQLPVRHLFGVSQNSYALARDVSLAVPVHSQHSLEFVRKYLDEARSHRRPVIENPLRARAAGQLQMAGDEISYDLRILRFDQGLEIDRVEVATLFRKVKVLVEDVSDSAAHASGEIPSARSQHEHHSFGHVLAAMITDAFHHGGCSGVANRKSFSGDSVEKGFSTGCAIERNVSNQNVFFGCESGSPRWIHHQASTGQTLADIVISLAFERERHTVR